MSHGRTGEAVGIGVGISETSSGAALEKLMPFRRRSTGPRSNYITREGFERMRREAEQLWSVERPRVTQQVADAAALGDRSENAECMDSCMPIQNRRSYDSLV